jgi:hypothetical protein
MARRRVIAAVGGGQAGLRRGASESGGRGSLGEEDVALTSFMAGRSRLPAGGPRRRARAARGEFALVPVSRGLGRADEINGLLV